MQTEPISKITNEKKDKALTWKINFKNYTNCMQMTSGFTFAVACSVPEYVH